MNQQRIIINICGQCWIYIRCLNRYYTAQGVKNYSIESWRLIVGPDGLKVVTTNIGRFCEFYIGQAQSDNHCVREAACYSISELARKIRGEVNHPLKCQRSLVTFLKGISPFVHAMLETLLVCLGDESWPVRDSATLGLHWN